MTNRLPLKMAIEIVSFPSNGMVIFYSHVNVYEEISIHLISVLNAIQTLVWYLLQSFWVSF